MHVTTAPDGSHLIKDEQVEFQIDGNCFTWKGWSVKGLLFFYLKSKLMKGEQGNHG